jgi:hypothetical protein
MALNLKQLTSGMFSRVLLNSNFEKIENKVNDDLVHRQNGSAQMQQDLDMNNNSILNLGDPTASLGVATKNYVDTQDNAVLSAIQNIEANGTIRQESEEFTATQGQTVFTLTTTTFAGEDTLAVYVNGVRQSHSAYTASSPNLITFSGGLQDGDEVIFTVNESTSTTLTASQISGLTVDTVADLANAEHRTGSLQLLGFHTKGDGGGGVFYWDASKDKSEHNGGTVIDPDKAGLVANWATTQALYFTPEVTGQGCWVREYSGAVNVKWFGAKGDGVSDDTLAFKTVLNISVPFESSASAGLSVYAPIGVYILSDELQLKRSVELKGRGGGAPILPMTKLKFINNTRGIQINRGNTLGDTLEATGTGSSEGSVIESIWLEGNGVTNSYCNGFHLRARAVIRNCKATNFGNDGCHIVATFSSTDGYAFGNANTFHLENCSFRDNARHGFYCDGADVNAGTIHGCDSSHNGGDSFHDSSFLGNTYTGCHADPDAGYGYVTDNDNSATVFLNCYCEVASLSKGKRRTLFIGGEGISLETGSSAITIGGSSIEGLTSKRFIARDTDRDTATEAYTILQQYRSNRDILTTKNEDLNSDVFRIKRNTEGDVELFNLNNLSNGAATKITGNTTTFTGGRDSTQPKAVVCSNLFLGNWNNSFTRRFSYHNAYSAPSFGTSVAKGEIYLKVNPSAGGTVGWVCTTSGIAGSTAVFKTFGNIGA